MSILAHFDLMDPDRYVLFLLASAVVIDLAAGWLWDNRGGDR